MRHWFIPLASVANLRVSCVIPIVFGLLTEPLLTLDSRGHHTMLVIGVLTLLLPFQTFPSIFRYLLVLREHTLDFNKGLLAFQGISEN